MLGCGMWEREERGMDGEREGRQFIWKEKKGGREGGRVVLDFET